MVFRDHDLKGRSVVFDSQVHRSADSGQNGGGGPRRTGSGKRCGGGGGGDATKEGCSGGAAGTRQSGGKPAVSD